ASKIWWELVSCFSRGSREGSRSDSGGAFGGLLRGRAVSTLPVEHVVAGQRHGVDRLGQLHLEHQHALVAERQFGAHQIGFPHAAEALVVERPDALAVLLEPR